MQKMQIKFEYNKELKYKDELIDLICWTISNQDIPIDYYCKTRNLGCKEVGGSTYECKDCVRNMFENLMKGNNNEKDKI